MKGNIEKILKKTCSVFGISEEDLKSRRKSRNLVYARMICAKYISYSCRECSRVIGDVINRNSSTVRYYLSIFEQEYRYNRDFRNFANAMKEVTLDMRTGFQEELDDELNEIIG